MSTAEMQDRVMDEHSRDRRHRQLLDTADAAGLTAVPDMTICAVKLRGGR